MPESILHQHSVSQILGPVRESLQAQGDGGGDGGPLELGVPPVVLGLGGSLRMMDEV